MRLFVLLLFASMSTALARAGPLLADALDMQKIIDNVRQNEALFEDIEFTLSWKVSASQRPNPFLSKNSKSGSRGFTERTLVVRQGTRVRVESNLNDYHDLFASDGKRTRYVQKRALVNLSDDPWIERLKLPHNILLQKAFVVFPLSTYLTGGDAVNVYPKYDQWNVTTQYLGAEVKNGFPCVRIRIKTWPKDQDSSRGDIRDLWLATERNYLPLQTVGYALRYSDKIPLEICNVDAFREVKPDIWYPQKATFRVNDEREASQGKTVFSHSETYTIEKISLDPHHDDAYFRDVELPDGAQVYVVKNKEIVKSYIQGKRDAPKWSRLPIFLIVGLFLAALMIAAAWLIRQRHFRTPRSRLPLASG